MVVALEERETLRGHRDEEGLQNPTEAAQDHIPVHTKLGDKPIGFWDDFLFGDSLAQGLFVGWFLFVGF